MANMVTTATTRAKVQNTAAPEAEKRVILSMGGKGGVGIMPRAGLCRIGWFHPSKTGAQALLTRHNPVQRAPTIGTYENTTCRL